MTIFKLLLNFYKLSFLIELKMFIIFILHCINYLFIPSVIKLLITYKLSF